MSEKKKPIMKQTNIVKKKRSSKKISYNVFSEGQLIANVYNKLFVM